MTSRKEFLRKIFPASEIAQIASPEGNEIALNRMSYGATQSMIDKVKKTGLKAFIDEQLNPPTEDDAKVKEKIESTTLHIKYDSKEDKYAAVDEDRPLGLWNATIEKLWPLTDYKTIMAGPERSRPIEELRTVTWIRGVYSLWQLKEVLVDFWHNHFNVSASTDTKISTTLPIYDRDVIRKNCMGNFRAFLEDVATSTAMQYYLDNFSSKASPANENYARELFELHTLGSDHYYNNLYNRWREVPGALAGKPIGYIDEDVYEAARAFTGWTIADGSNTGKGENLPNTGLFYYYDGWHDNYQKRVLGTEFDPNQSPLTDGKKVLDLVAYHPATANHICHKLCQRLISDVPPDNVVKGAVVVWTKYQKSPNQIREVLRYILLTKEFSTGWGQKVKRPFDLMVSILRITDADFTPNPGLTGMLSQMGQYQFHWPTPTGHPDKSEYWLSSNTMLARWNLALNLVANGNNKISSFQFRSAMPLDLQKPSQIVPHWIERILQKKTPQEFIDSMTLHFANGKNINEPLSNGDIDKRIPPFVAMLTMTPDFQLK